jgi:hypothetical protein
MPHSSKHIPRPPDTSLSYPRSHTTALQFAAYYRWLTLAGPLALSSATAAQWAAFAVLMGCGQVRREIRESPNLPLPCSLCYLLPPGGVTLKRVHPQCLLVQALNAGIYRAIGKKGVRASPVVIWPRGLVSSHRLLPPSHPSGVLRLQAGLQGPVGAHKGGHPIETCHTLLTRLGMHR